MRLGAVTLVAALPFATQEEPRPQVPPPQALVAKPAPIAVDRAAAPAAIALSFKLAEEGGSKLRVVFAAVPAAGASATPERHVLALDFDPFEGARWSWSSGPDATPTARATLTQVPEPKELEYRVRLVFPPERGLCVLLPDDLPILVARTPRASALVVSFEADGGVLALTAASAETGADSRLAAALAHAPRSEADASDPGSASSPDSWSIAELADAPAPELFGIHPEDELPAPEGVVERTILEPSEEVRVPTIVLRPERRAADRAALVIAGGRRGKAAPGAVARMASLAQGGALVVAFDLLGRGERTQLLPFDSLESPEPLLIGRSPQQYAATEARQILAWMKAREDASAAKVELWLNGEARATFEKAGALRSASAAPPIPATASPALADAATLGEELVRPRYDSWFLIELIEGRESLPPPDRTIPLAKRIAPSGPKPVDEAALRLEAALAWNPSKGVRPLGELGASPSARASRVTLCASEFGAASALFAAVKARAPGVLADDEWLVGVDDPPLDGIDHAGSLLDERVARIVALVSRLARPAGGRVHLFGEGTSGIVMLLAATLRPELVASVTATDSLPSFELLLRRPPEAPRAPCSLGVLSQGMPSDLFLNDVLSRFDLEECVLELRSRDVAVDWRAPVDALRRPLSRHDRLALWPRVRHAERKP